MIVGREKPSNLEIHTYLTNLRNSGVTNMYGSGRYLEQVFGLTQHEARAAVLRWMKAMSEQE